MHRRHIAQLDGLRGLAVLLVLLAHSAIAFTRVPSLKWIDSYGSLGVQLFFVLSGFLITGILLDSKGTPYFFRNFFVRRGLRIYPLYYALLGFVVFSGVVHRHGVHWWPYILYLSNFFGGITQPAPLGVAWSLAVEEQFYLLWPFIVSVLSLRSLERFCFATIICAPSCLRITGVLALHNTLPAVGCLGRGSPDSLPSRSDRFLASISSLLRLSSPSWRQPARWIMEQLVATLQVLAVRLLLIVLLDNQAVSSDCFVRQLCAI